MALVVSNMTHTMNERELDRYCWLLVSWRNRFSLPDETAEECIESFEKDDEVAIDERGRGEEYGYHRGMFIAHNEMMEQLYGYGINVIGRANRYTKVNREYDMEFRLGSEPDYYLAQERGAEIKVMQNPLWEDVEIESLGRADYVPEGAEDV